MSVNFRIILIFGSVLTLIFILRKIRKSQINLEETLFWIFFSFVLALMAIFTPIAKYGANLFGIQSTTNFVFLSIIFVLLIKIFLISIKISKLQNNIKTLTQKFSLNEIDLSNDINKQLSKNQNSN